jgi:hypothetical protein
VAGWVLAYVPQYGWMYIPVARGRSPIAVSGNRPDQELPETPEPKPASTSPRR